MRSIEEFEWPDDNISGSLLIPLPELEPRGGEIPAGKPVVVVGHSGSRSALATQQLLNAGRKQVANLRGGLSRWGDEGYLSPGRNRRRQSGELTQTFGNSPEIVRVRDIRLHSHCRSDPLAIVPVSTTAMTHTPARQRISASDLADQLAQQRVTVIDVREPMEYAGGHIAGSPNVPLARLHQADLPQGSLVLVCQSGNRSAKGGVSNADPRLELVWAYGQRFCCEQLFRDQKSGIFQLASSGLREPERIDRLLLIVAIAVLVGSLQGYAISLAGLRRQVDPHWRRGMSFVRIGLATLQAFVADTKARLMTWMPIPQRDLGPCLPSRGVRRRRTQPWFTRIELPPRSQPQHLDPLPLAVA